jgi:hypothetical protein
MATGKLGIVRERDIAIRIPAHQQRTGVKRNHSRRPVGLGDQQFLHGGKRFYITSPKPSETSSCPMRPLRFWRKSNGLPFWYCRTSKRMAKMGETRNFTPPP